MAVIRPWAHALRAIGGGDHCLQPNLSHAYSQCKPPRAPQYWLIVPQTSINWIYNIIEFWILMFPYQVKCRTELYTHILCVLHDRVVTHCVYNKETLRILAEMKQIFDDAQDGICFPTLFFFPVLNKALDCASTTPIPNTESLSCCRGSECCCVPEGKQTWCCRPVTAGTYYPMSAKQ